MNEDRIPGHYIVHQRQAPQTTSEASEPVLPFSKFRRMRAVRKAAFLPPGVSQLLGLLLLFLRLVRVGRVVVVLLVVVLAFDVAAAGGVCGAGHRARES